MNITGGPDMGLFEVNEAATIIRQAAHSDCNVIFGAVIDESIGDHLRVTVIATGFDGPKQPERAAERSATSWRREPLFPTFEAPESTVPSFGNQERNELEVGDDDDALDVPSFLRDK
jgi:cell division protein FtsZ